MNNYQAEKSWNRARKGKIGYVTPLVECQCGKRSKFYAQIGDEKVCKHCYMELKLKEEREV